MTSIIYGLKTTFRKPSIWLGTFLGIMLAVGLMFSVFMTVDYAGVATIRRYTDLVRVDFRANMYFFFEGSENIFSWIASNHEEFIEGLKSIDYIEKVEFIFRTSLPNGFSLVKENKSSLSITENITPIFFIRQSPEFEGVYINGSLEEGIGLGREIAKYLGVDVGDEVTLSAPFLNKSYNITISAIVSFDGEFFENYFWVETNSFWSELYQSVGFLSEAPSLPTSTNPNYGIIVFLDDWENLFSLLENAFGIEELDIILIREAGNAEAFIVLNDSIIDPWNLEKTKAEINRVFNEMRLYLQQYFPSDYFYITSYIMNAVSYVEMRLLGVRISSLLMMLPILILSVILALIANWILINKRRRELGLLRIRGMSPKQIFISFISEIILVGILAGLTGIGIAYGASYLISKTLAKSLAEIVDPIVVLNAVVDDYVVPAIIVGIVLGFISIFYPARRVSKLDLLTSISEYVPEIEKEVKVGKALWVFIIISVYGLSELLLGMPTFRFLMTEIMRGRYFLSLLLMIYMPIYFIGVIGGPFILAYGCAKLLAAYSDRFSKILEIISKPFSGDLSRFAVDQFVRKKARVYKVILLITLTLVFGIYFTINSATNRARIKVNLKISIGADIKLSLYNPISYNEIPSINRTIYYVEGVNRIAYTSEILLPYDPSTNISRLIVLDYSYPEVSYFEGSYVEGLSVSELNDVLHDPTKILLPISYKGVKGYEIGSTVYLPIIVNNTEKIFKFTVAGYIKWCPGLFGLFSLQLHKYYAFVGPAIIDRIKSLEETLLVQTILVDVKSGYNATYVGEEIRNMLEDIDVPVSVQVFRKALNDIYNNWIFVFEQIFVDVLFYLSIIMAIIGMSLTMATSIFERRREIALLRARGASLRDLLGMVLGEVAVITILGYLLGIGLAFAYTYGFLVVMFTVSFVFMGMTVEFPPGYLMAIPQKLYFVVGGAFVMFLFSAIVPLLVLVREDISQELRITH